jgi:hypothetical protein
MTVSRRHLLFAASGLLAAGACTPGGDVRPAPSVSPGLTALPPPTVRAPDGGVIRVVDQGVSALTDPSGKPLASYGVVVENTGRGLVAVKVALSVRLTGADGRPVHDTVQGTAGSDATNRIVIQVFPGQRAGIGATTYVDRPGVAGIHVDAGPATWLPSGNGLVEVAALDASGVAVKVPGGRFPAVVTFTVTSGFHEAVDHPAAQAVFRDAAGRIVGGTGPDRTNPADRYGPGTSHGEIDVTYGLPRGTDATRTEVYLAPTAR